MKASAEQLVPGHSIYSCLCTSLRVGDAVTQLLQELLGIPGTARPGHLCNIYHNQQEFVSPHGRISNKREIKIARQSMYFTTKIETLNKSMRLEIRHFGFES